MPGISEGIPGAKAYDELREQKQVVIRRNQEDGPPDKQILIEPQTTDEHRASVLTALGVGRNITGQA